MSDIGETMLSACDARARCSHLLAVLDVNVALARQPPTQMRLAIVPSGCVDIDRSDQATNRDAFKLLLWNQREGKGAGPSITRFTGSFIECSADQLTTEMSLLR